LSLIAGLSWKQPEPDPGVWGNGRMDFGVMSVLGKHQTTPASHRSGYQPAWFNYPCGHCQDRETLQTAEEVPVRGLILASMSAALVPTATRLNIPVIIVEGLGREKNEFGAFKLLTPTTARSSRERRNMDLYLGTRRRYSSIARDRQRLRAPRIGTYAPNARCVSYARQCG